MSHILTVDGYLDGSYKSSLSGYGTFDLYIDGVQVKNDSTGVEYDVDLDSTYEVKDIKASTGRRYTGVKNGAALKGTISGTLDITLEFKSNTYTVKYNGNGSTGGSTSNSSHTYGTSKKLTANGFTRTGYTFSGWNTKADGSGTEYSDQASVKNLTSTNGGSVTLYAQWAPALYHLTISQGSNTSITVNRTSSPIGSTVGAATGNLVNGAFLYYGDVLSISVSASAGYTLSASHSNGSTITVTESTTISATATANTYTVTYNANNGSGTMSNSTATYNSNFMTRKNAFTRTGYTFNGWNEKADGTGTKWTLTSPGVYEYGSYWKWTYTKNITLYAQWTANTYTIAYNANGGTGSTASSSHTYDVAKTLTANGFTRTGYTFAGWNTKADGSGTNYSNSQSVKNLTSTAGETVTLYAKWTANTYYLAFDYNYQQSFNSNEFANTGYIPNWNKTFSIEQKITVPSIGKRMLIIGNYDGTSTSANIEINAAGALRLYMSGAGIDKTSGTVTAGEVILVSFAWNGSSKEYTLSATGTKTNISFSGTGSGMTGSASNAFRIGTVDCRGSSGTFYPITVSHLRFYEQRAYGSAIGTLPSAARDGYTLNGWYTAASGGSAISSSTTMPAANTPYYAQWTKNTYTLTISKGNGVNVTVSRTSSPIGGASTGTLSSGATIYYNDVLKIECSTSNTDYGDPTLTVNSTKFTSGNSYTVTSNVTVAASATYTKTSLTMPTFRASSGHIRGFAYVWNGSKWVILSANIFN